MHLLSEECVEELFRLILSKITFQDETMLRQFMEELLQIIRREVAWKMRVMRELERMHFTALRERVHRN